MPTQQDTFTDESKLNETLGSTVTGGELISDDLQLGNVLSFDGVNDYVSVPDSASIDITPSITMSAWIKPEADATNAILSRGDTHTSFNSISYRMFTATNGRFAGIICDSGVWGSAQVKYYLSDEYVFTLGVWSHIAATFDGTDLKLYVNAIEVGISNYVYDAAITSIHTSSESIEIGRLIYSGSGASYNDGGISQIAVFDYALTQSQMTDLYKYGYDNAQSLQPAVSYWKLDEGTGTTATITFGSAPPANDGSTGGHIISIVHGLAKLGE